MVRKKHKRDNIDLDTRVECPICLYSEWVNFNDTLTTGWPRCCSTRMEMVDGHTDLVEEIDKILVKKKVRLRSKYSEKRYIP